MSKLELILGNRLGMVIGVRIEWHIRVSRVSCLATIDEAFEALIVCLPCGYLYLLVVRSWLVVHMETW